MNIKLNKIAENRLNEKEMGALKGGTNYEWHIVSNRRKTCECVGICGCDDFIMPSFPFNIVNLVSSTGVGSVTIVRDNSCTT
jgi:natural product precursor